jgi:hypothetical protein
MVAEDEEQKEEKEKRGKSEIAFPNNEPLGQLRAFATASGYIPGTNSLHETWGKIAFALLLEVKLEV